MTKIIILIASLFLTLNLFSQNVLLEQESLIKEYNLNQIRETNYLDSVTIMTTASITETGLVKDIVLLSKLEKGVYKTRKLNISHNEIWKYGKEFFKKDGAIFRLRADKVKKEIYYYIDELKDDSFVLTTNPFFKGLISLGYSESFDFVLMDGYFSIVNSIMKYNTPFYINVNVSIFSNENEFISSKNVEIDKEIHVKDVKISRLDNYLIVLYTFLGESEKRNVKILFSNGTDISEINSTQSFAQIEVLKQDGNYLLHNFNPWENCEQALYKFDFLNSKLEELEKSNIDIKILTRDYGTSELTDDQKRINWKYCDIVESTDGSTYLFYYGTTYHSQVGTTFKDVILTKIQNNEIVCNQYISRSSRVNHDSYFRNINVEGPEIVMEDITRKGSIDSKGKIIPKDLNNGMDILSNYDEVIISIDKKTGNIKRKIKK